MNARKPPPRQAVADLLMENFLSKLERVRQSGPFELSLHVKELCESVRVLMLDTRRRLVALEHLATDPSPGDGVIM